MKKIERQAVHLMEALETLVQRLLLSRIPAQADLPQLNPMDPQTLLVIAERGPVTMTVLSEALGVPLSTATHRVDRLVKFGLCERSRSEEDRRIVEVKLSAKGAELNEFMVMTRLAMAHDMLLPLTPAERQTLVELMTKVSEQAQVSSRPIPPMPF